nr:unnamed protein product [Digitaria exilis]
MRKEIIIRLHVKSDKCQAKAMKVSAAVKGVESVTLAGGDKSLLLVIGTAVDSNKLIKKLKKKAGEAEIVELRTHDTFEAAALPLPGTKQEMAALARSSPYNGHHQWQQHNNSYYAVAPTSPYAHHYYPSPVGGYGYGYGGYGGARVSSYSLAAAHSHPGNYSPLVERHDYQPMDKSKNSSASSKQRQSSSSVPRRGGGGDSCVIL